MKTYCCLLRQLYHTGQETLGNIQRGHQPLMETQHVDIHDKLIKLIFYSIKTKPHYTVCPNQQYNSMEFSKIFDTRMYLLCFIIIIIIRFQVNPEMLLQPSELEQLLGNESNNMKQAINICYYLTV